MEDLEIKLKPNEVQFQLISGRVETVFDDDDDVFQGEDVSNFSLQESFMNSKHGEKDVVSVDQRCSFSTEKPTD